MKIVLLCSSPEHPIVPVLEQWRERVSAQHDVEIVSRKAELCGGDILFLISCHESVGSNDRAKFQNVLVIHASRLPEGRGWSPHVWEILKGAKKLTVTLLEAVDEIDAGPIWKQVEVDIPETALFDEINAQLFSAEIELMNFAVENAAVVQPKLQNASGAETHYRKRTPIDSKLDPNKSIADQFDLIRVSDPERYPAFFEFRGRTYRIRLEDADGSAD